MVRLVQRNVSVELSRELQKYHLPLESFNKEKETKSIQAGLSFLGIGKKRNYLSTLLTDSLSTTYYYTQPQCLISLGIYWATPGLYINFYSCCRFSVIFWQFREIYLPYLISVTQHNSIERRSFTLKDTLMVLDDYHPSAQKSGSVKDGKHCSTSYQSV